MTKAKDYSDVKVGVFVFIGIVTFVATITILGANQFLFKEQIQLKTQFIEAQGLGEGSLVSLAGIPIGYVSTLEIADNSSSVVVHMDIDQSYQKQLTTAAIATLKTQGALGDRYVYITPKREGEVLSSGDFIAADHRPDFLDAISERTNDFDNIGEVIRELSVLMKSINEKDRSARLMESLASTSKNLDGLTSNPQLKKSLNHLNNILRKVDEGDGTLGRLINDPALHEKILQLMGDSPRNRYLKPLIQNSIRHKAEASK